MGDLFFGCNLNCHYVKNLEADPDGWYCYIAMYFLGSGDVLLGYCAGNRPQGTGLSVTHVTKLSQKWLYSGQ